MEAKAPKYSDFRDHVLVIPPFQRPYSWGKTEWVQLWQELGEQYFELATGEEGRTNTPVFLGALVRQQITPRVLGERRIEDTSLLIDGQQRMVTLAVLAAAIRDRFLVVDPEKQAEWNADFLLVREDELRIPKIEVQKVDRSTFNSIIMPREGVAPGEPGDATSKIKRAYDFFYSLLGHPEEQLFETIAMTEDELSRMLTGPAGKGEQIQYRKLKEVLRSIRFVDITLGKDDSFAAEIFESLNSKGMALSPVDLVRNGFYLLLAQMDNEDDGFSRFWIPLEAAHRRIRAGAGKRELPTLHDFIGDEAIRRFGWVPSNLIYGKLFGQIRSIAFQSVADGGQLRGPKYGESISRSLGEITRNDDLYRYLIGKNRGTSASVRREHSLDSRFSFLSEWDSKPMRPLLLQLAIMFEEGDIDEDDCCVALDLLQAFLVRRRIAGLPNQLLRPMLSPIPSKIRVVDPLDALIRQLNKLGPEKLPTKTLIRRNWRHQAYSQKRSLNKQLGLVFWELEKMLDDERRHTWTEFRFGARRDSFSIEHVMPASLITDSPVARRGKGNSRRVSPQDVWASDLTGWGVKSVAEFANDYCHVLGNLTLSMHGHNSAYGARRYQDKLAEYRKRTTLRITTESVLMHKKWTMEAIRDRSYWLIDCVCKRWPLPWETA